MKTRKLLSAMERVLSVLVSILWAIFLSIPAIPLMIIHHDFHKHSP